MDNVERLEALYDRADNLTGFVVRATLTELCRESRGGMTDSRIDYWTSRLTRLIDDVEANDALDAI